MKVFAIFVSLYADYSDTSNLQEGFRNFHTTNENSCLNEVVRAFSKDSEYISEAQEYISSFFISDAPELNIYKDSCSWSYGSSEYEEDVSYTVNIKEVTSRDMALGILYSNNSSLSDQEYEELLPEVFRK